MMMRRSSVVLFVTLTLLALVAAARPGAVRADGGGEPYCCLCGACPEAACVLVDVMPEASGGASVGRECPGFCPPNCERSVLLEGACALHTEADCPVTERAPALSLWGIAIGIVGLGAYGLRRVQRS